MTKKIICTVPKLLSLSTELKTKIRKTENNICFAINKQINANMNIGYIRKVRQKKNKRAEKNFKLRS